MSESDPNLSFETERRFLVRDTDVVSSAQSWEMIEQAYVFAVEGFAIRVRIVSRATDGQPAEQATLTGKGPRIGLRREEYEVAVSVLWARGVIDRARNVVRKRRYQFIAGLDQTWEIDEFLGRNEGLWIAELEGGPSIRGVPTPRWALKEILNEPSLDNESLAVRPISKWSYEELVTLRTPGW